LVSTAFTQLQLRHQKRLLYLRDPKFKVILAWLRQQLFHLARKRNENFGVIFTGDWLEPTPSHFSKSTYRQVFILKSVLLDGQWVNNEHVGLEDALDGRGDFIGCQTIGTDSEEA
jgi:hypothetical protein